MKDLDLDADNTQVRVYATKAAQAGWGGGGGGNPPPTGTPGGTPRAPAPPRPPLVSRRWGTPPPKPPFPIEHPPLPAAALARG